MIPADWVRHVRGDGELIGYLAPQGDDLFTAMTLLGTPLGEPVDEWTAADALDDVGLSYLADRWILTDPEGSERPVVLVEASPERVMVAPADFALVVGMPRDPADEIAIEVPTDRLRRA